MSLLRTSGSGPAVLVPGTDASGTATNVAIPAFASVDANGNLPDPVTAFTSGNVANASAAAVMAAVPNKTNYVTGLNITSTGATAPAVVLASLNNVLGGNLSFVQAVSTGALVANPSLTLTFSPPLQASALNTAVTAVLPALGAGNTNAVVTLYGYTA